MTTLMKYFVLPLGLSGSLLLGACSVLPEARPMDVYQLPTRLVVAATHPVQAGTGTSLRIARPAAAGVLSGNRIVVAMPDHRLSIYPAARWNQAAPGLLRERLLDAFRADGRIAGLSNDEEALQADYEIGSDLRSFQIEYVDETEGVTGRAVASVSIDVRLVRGDSRRITAVQRFTVKEPSEGVGLPQQVAALGRAADRLAGEVAAWALVQMGTAAK